MIDAPQPSKRIVAVDVLRGITIAAMILVNNPGSWGHIYAPLGHADWHGWTPTDLVFPFFLFLVGVSIVLGLQKRIDSGADRAALLRKIATRTALLFGIGFFLNCYPFYPKFDLDTVRIPGVLQRIAVCYGITAMLFVTCSLRALQWICGFCLLGYWAAMVWIPVPGFGAGLIDEKGSHLSAYVDRAVLGTKHLWVHAKVYDPEGILSTVPSVATTLLGVFTGRILRTDATPSDKVVTLFVRGSALVLLGFVWDWFFPINKKIWTSSYAVFTAGLAMSALGLIAYHTDVRGRRRWARCLEIYGVNALTVFVMSALLVKTMALIKIDGVALKPWIYRSCFLSWADGEVASLAFALTWVAGWFVVLWAMWQKRIVWRV